MEYRKQFRDEMHALTSIANSLDRLLELTYEEISAKEAAEDSPYYTIREAAARIKRSTRHVRRLVVDGKLKQVNAEGPPIFLKTDIDDPGLMS